MTEKEIVDALAQIDPDQLEPVWREIYDLIMEHGLF